MVLPCTNHCNLKANKGCLLVYSSTQESTAGGTNISEHQSLWQEKQASHILLLKHHPYQLIQWGLPFSFQVCTCPGDLFCLKRVRQLQCEQNVKMKATVVGIVAHISLNAEFVSTTPGGSMNNNVCIGRSISRYLGSQYLKSAFP